VSIIHECDQGTPEWHALRLGIPTASEFDKIITPSGKPSASARPYMARLLAERLLGESQGANLDGIPAVDIGKLLEPQAASMFEFEHDCATMRVGFVTSDDGRWGASPDRFFIGGVLEIKCPQAPKHMLYAIDGFGPEYKVQVQGQLLVVDCDAAARYSFHQRLPAVTTWTYRDDPFIAKLRDELTRFSDELDEWTERLRKSGAFHERRAIENASPYTGSLHDWTLEGEHKLRNPMIAA
jgi:hypothetical protein